MSREDKIVYLKGNSYESVSDEDLSLMYNIVKGSKEERKGAQKKEEKPCPLNASQRDKGMKCLMMKCVLCDAERVKEYNLISTAIKNSIKRKPCTYYLEEPKDCNCSEDKYF